MPHAPEPRTRLSIAARFPRGFFLENVAVRPDNSALVTLVDPKVLFYLPPLRAVGEVEPVPLHGFEEPAGGIVELEPDVFLVFTSNVYTTHESYAHRFDLRSWTPGAPVIPELIFTFPTAARGLNGACALSPGVVLVADTFAGLIWRLDLACEGGARAEVWLRHDSMAHIPDTLPPPPQPGVNGVRYSARTGRVYYTTTGQKLFMRVRVDPDTLNAAGEPELVARGGMYDDFCLDEARSVAYLTVHRENRIDRVALEPSAGEPPLAIAGPPLDDLMFGPSSAAWSRAPGEAGRVLYVATDGGRTAPPPDGNVREARLLRLELL